MEKYRAIPQGYMTTGEAARKMGVTVRTLQYYDREGLCSPSAESEGKRRLYTDRDLVRLHQILSLKHLGFSLNEIRNCLISMETPEEVAEALKEQAEAIQEKIESLSEMKKEIEALRSEVLQIGQVDFKKYADIIVNLQMKNEYYWLIKHFDEKTLDHIRSRFSKESGLAFMEKFSGMQEEAVRLKEEGVLPESREGRGFAEKYWKMIQEFTGGDMTLLSGLVKMGNLEGEDGEWKKRQALANSYVGQALDAYFKASGEQPFEGGEA